MKPERSPIEALHVRRVLARASDRAESRALESFSSLFRPARKMMLDAPRRHRYVEALEQLIRSFPLDPTVEEMESTRVARWGKVDPYGETFIESRLPGMKKNLYKIINRGVLENKRSSSR